MITINLTWHLMVMLILQVIIICRWLYINNTEKGGGYLGKGLASGLAFIFYGFISITGWLIYGGIVWW